MNWLRRKLGYASAPAGIDLVLTDDCNLKCAYCARGGSSRTAPVPAYMEVARALDLVDELAELRPRPFIRLFGGEPFLHPEWDRIVRHASDRGVWCTAVTNGTLLGEHARRLTDSGLLAVGISLDGHAGIHDPVRGRGTFDRIMAGLEALEDCRKGSGSPHPLVEIYATVQPSNVGRLVEFARFLAGKPIALLRLQHLIWCTPEQFERTRRLVAPLFPGQAVLEEEAPYQRAGPPDVDPVVFLRQKRELERTRWPFKVEFHPNLPDRQWTPFLTQSSCGPRDSEHCRNMEAYAYIRPTGALRPCVSVEIGNVFERPFRELWNAAGFRAFRRLVRSHGRLPACARCPD